MPVAGGGSNSQDPVKPPTPATPTPTPPPTPAAATPTPPAATPPAPTLTTDPTDASTVSNALSSQGLDQALAPEVTALMAEGVPASSEGATFVAEEQSAYEAQGGAQSGNPFAGWSLPPQYAGDFWQLYSQAQTFAANTGWKYLLTPQQLNQGLAAGMADASSETLFAWMAQVTGVDTTAQPWALTGLNATQYSQAANALNDTVFELTGKDDWASAGLDQSQLATAITQGWSAGQITDYIQKNPALNSQYGYLQYGMTSYNQFQNYQLTNKQALSERYGNSFTSQQAIQNLASPLSTFKASGGAFGQFQPYVQSPTTMPTGNQSRVR